MSLKNTTTQMLYLLLSPLQKSPLSLRNNLHGSKLHLACLCSSLRTEGTNLSHNLKQCIYCTATLNVSGYRHITTCCLWWPWLDRRSTAEMFRCISIFCSAIDKPLLEWASLWQLKGFSISKYKHAHIFSLAAAAVNEYTFKRLLHKGIYFFCLKVCSHSVH